MVTETQSSKDCPSFELQGDFWKALFQGDCGMLESLAHRIITKEQKVRRAQALRRVRIETMVQGNAPPIPSYACLMLISKVWGDKLAGLWGTSNTMHETSSDS